MQVDQKPSPWPCVVMLLGLLLLCPVLPRLWKSTAREHEGARSSAATDDVNKVCEKRQTAIDELAAQVLGTIAKVAKESGASCDKSCPKNPIEFSFLSEMPPSGCLPPTLGSLSSPGLAFAWPVNSQPNSFDSVAIAGQGLGDATSPRNAIWPEVAENVSVVADAPSPYVLTAIAGIGQIVADYVTADITSWLASRVAAFEPIPLFTRHVAVEEPAVEQPFPESFPAEDTSKIVIMPLTDPVLRGDAPNAPLVVEPASSLPNSADLNDTEPAGIVGESSLPLVNQPSVDDAELPTERPETQEAAAAPEAFSPPWSVPSTLLEQLEILAQYPYSASWALSTIDQLRALAACDSADDRDIGAALGQLAQSTEQASQLAAQASDARLRVELLRSHWALKRRLDCWKVVWEVHTVAKASPRIATRGSLQSLFAGVAQAPPESSDLPALSENLESYERSRDPRLARQVARQRQFLSESTNKLDQSLGNAVEENYRNANVRVALTAELINRVIAKRREENRSVRDRIAGTPVRGYSQTTSQSRISL